MRLLGDWVSKRGLLEKVPSEGSSRERVPRRLVNRLAHRSCNDSEEAR